MILTHVLTCAAGATCRIVDLIEKQMGEQIVEFTKPCHSVSHVFRCIPLEVQERFTWCYCFS